VLNDKLIVLVMVTSLILPGIFSSPVEVSQARPDKFAIDYQKDNIYVSLDYKGERLSLESECRNVAYAANQIELNNKLKFTPTGISWGNIDIPYDLLKQTELQKISKDRVYIEFEIRETPPKRRIPRDITNAFTPLAIDSEQFVRGYVLNIGSDVDIYGEVSENVFCLFGNVTLHSRSLVRRDVIAVCGRVYRHEDSQVYGQIISQEGHQKGGRKFGPRRGYYKALSFGMDVDYNRVDGLYLEGLLEFKDPDHIFPSLTAGLGYAFTADRLRYRLEASQKFFGNYSIEPYGALYRKTATEDDWICGHYENMVFALLAKQDYRDYFEEEGGSIGLKVNLGSYNSLDFKYSYDNLDWMDAHPRLWSLFGPDRFRRNWSSLPKDYLQEHFSDFTSKLSLFKFTYVLDMLSDYINPPTGWWAKFEYEKAGGDLKGDLSYARWWITGIRYQPLNRYLGLKLRVTYGGSSDSLPLFKKFYLGGIRTLYGYDIKQFYGDQMFMANVQYLINFGTAALRGKIFFDIGKVTGQDNNIFDDGEFKSDVGLGFGLSSDFQILMAKALDDSDSDIKFWVQFARSF
jgi:hypothetical protein